MTIIAVSIFLLLLALAGTGFSEQLPSSPKLLSEDLYPLTREGIQPYFLSYNEEDWQYLLLRLKQTRIPYVTEEKSWKYGISQHELLRLKEYWQDKYSWKRTTEQLNKSGRQLVAQIEGLQIHFEVWKPTTVSPTKTIVPILFLHGWPGSFLECHKLAKQIVYTSGDSEFQYFVFCPSLPGYGLSSAPNASFNVDDMARVMRTLMVDRLGIDRYFVQGGDWGSIIAWKMALQYPSNVLGLHINFFGQGPPPTFSTLLAGGLAFVFSEDSWVWSLFGQCIRDSANLIRKTPRVALEEAGYMHIQGTCPDTVAYGLNDSPVGLLAYIGEKFYAWSDNNGSIFDSFTEDEILDNVMLYWTQENIGSSMRLYKDHFASVQIGERRTRIDSVPMAGAIFPGEVIPIPRCWAEVDFNVQQWSVMPRGGHFAAMEEPKLLAEDLLKFIKLVFGGSKGTAQNKHSDL